MNLRQTKTIFLLPLLTLLSSNLAFAVDTEIRLSTAVQEIHSFVGNGFQSTNCRVSFSKDTIQPEVGMQLNLQSSERSGSISLHTPIVSRSFYDSPATLDYYYKNATGSAFSEVEMGLHIRYFKRNKILLVHLSGTNDAGFSCEGPSRL